MSYLERFSVSLDAELLAAFDHHLVERGYTNRSEAVRDLIRDRLLAEAAPKESGRLVGVVAFLLDRRSEDVAQRLRELLLAAGPLLAGQWSRPVDAEQDVCAVLLDGPAPDVRRLAGRIEALRGVCHARLHLLPTGEPAAYPEAAITPAAE